MSRFREGMRCKIVQPIYGWESVAAEYMGRTVVLGRSTSRTDAGTAWYFKLEPKFPRGHVLADAFNNGWLWVQEASIRPRGFSVWVADMEARWPQEHA